MNKQLRRTIIAGNWKLNKRVAEVAPFMDALKAALPEGNRAAVVICAPYPLVPAVCAAGAPIVAGGAQDCSAYEKGAYTGEVSVEQLADTGAKWCIVGHSERRAYHAETDAAVNAKVRRLLDAGVTPIICVGESLAQREQALTAQLVAYQTAAALSGLTAEQAARCVLAYEPLWAIGTGNTATSDQAQEVCGAIRGVLGGLFGGDTADRVSILYGGSMNAGNAAELLAQPDIDGGLIGGASLKPEELAKIVAAAQG